LNFDIQELYIYTLANQSSGEARFLIRILPARSCYNVAGGPARNASPARHADASHAGWRSDAGGIKIQILNFETITSSKMK